MPSAVRASIAFAGRLYRSGRLTLWKAINQLFTLKDEPIISGETRSAIYVLDDRMDSTSLRDAEGLKKVEDMFLKFTSPYVDELSAIESAMFGTN